MKTEIKFCAETLSEFTKSCRNPVEHPVYGKHAVTPLQVLRGGTDYKAKLFNAYKESLK